MLQDSADSSFHSSSTRSARLQLESHSNPFGRERNLHAEIVKLSLQLAYSFEQKGVISTADIADEQEAINRHVLCWLQIERV